jgi:ubiquinone/menaquinone biosynthesis C-methylase UbiE
MTQIVFDEDMAARLEAAYRARDVKRRRSLVLSALAPQPGEHIIDIGCGPGFYAPDLLDAVGATGAVLGVDSSAAVLRPAEQRCAGRANAQFRQGDAAALPADDSAFDAALCVQVLEYAQDSAAALSEMRRVLRPGGRVVVWDVDWATLSWRSRSDERMARMLRAWDAHLAHPSLPQLLPFQLRDTGFIDVAFEGHVFASTSLSPDSYVGAIFPLVAAFLEERADDEARAWAEEQRLLDASGEFFFACTQFCFTARKG